MVIAKQVHLRNYCITSYSKITLHYYESYEVDAIRHRFSNRQLSIPHRMELSLHSVHIVNFSLFFDIILFISSWLFIYWVFRTAHALLRIREDSVSAASQMLGVGCVPMSKLPYTAREFLPNLVSCLYSKHIRLRDGRQQLTPLLIAIWGKDAH